MRLRSEMRGRKIWVIAAGGRQFRPRRRHDRASAVDAGDDANGNGADEGRRFASHRFELLTNICVHRNDRRLYEDDPCLWQDIRGAEQRTRQSWYRLTVRGDLTLTVGLRVRHGSPKLVLSHAHQLVALHRVRFRKSLGDEDRIASGIAIPSIELHRCWGCRVALRPAPQRPGVAGRGKPSENHHKRVAVHGRHTITPPQAAASAGRCPSLTSSTHWLRWQGS